MSMEHKEKDTEKRYKRPSRRSECENSDDSPDDINKTRHKHDKEKRKSKHKRHRSSSSSSSEKRHKHKKSRKSKDEKSMIKNDKYGDSTKLDEKDYGIEIFGYTNDNNPFGDSNLSEPFRWKKKLKQVGLADMDKDEIDRMIIRNRAGAKAELEDIKKRKDQRNKKRAETQSENDRIQRDKESQFHKSWDEQDRIFELKQAKEKTKIRFNDGNPETIDLLAHYIYSKNDDIIADVSEPYNFLTELDEEALEGVIKDIEIFKKIDREVDESINEEYWNDIDVMANDELMTLMTSDSSTYYNATSSKESVLKEKVDEQFKELDLETLIGLKKQIEEKLNGRIGIDAGHWSFMLDRLKSHIAKKRLDINHKEILKNKLAKLKQNQGINVQPSSTKQASKYVEKADPTKGDCKDESLGTNKYDPILLKPEEIPKGIILVSVEEDLKRLEFNRINVLNTGQAQRDEEEEFLASARKSLKDDEEEFNTEVQLQPETSIWSDKYKPRKPKYFNKVHTGFEWNVYNRTHYDLDNPPPKNVLGYKFNIFYPDLIDKSKIPTYKVTICDDSNFSVIRFIAGPPYEDIAFKIVNSEWDRHDRRYRCEFNNKILNLCFHFRRLRYRR